MMQLQSGAGKITSNTVRNCIPLNLVNEMHVKIHPISSVAIMNDRSCSKYPWSIHYTVHFALISVVCSWHQEPQRLCSLQWMEAEEKRWNAHTCILTSVTRWSHDMHVTRTGHMTTLWYRQVTWQACDSYNTHVGEEHKEGGCIAQKWKK